MEGGRQEWRRERVLGLNLISNCSETNKIVTIIHFRKMPRGEGRREGEGEEGGRGGGGRMEGGEKREEGGRRGGGKER